MSRRSRVDVGHVWRPSWHMVSCMCKWYHRSSNTTSSMSRRSRVGVDHLWIPVSCLLFCWWHMVYCISSVIPCQTHTASCTCKLHGVCVCHLWSCSVHSWSCKCCMWSWVCWVCIHVYWHAYVCVCLHGTLLAKKLWFRQKMIIMSRHGTEDSVVILGPRCWSNLCVCVCALKNLLSSASSEALETDI